YLWALAPGWPPPVYAELSAWVVAAALICWTLAFAGELMARRRLNATSRPDERGDAGRRCASRSSTPLPLAGLGLHTLALGVLLAVLGSTIATLPPASGHAQAAVATVLLWYATVHVAAALIMSLFLMLRWRAGFVLAFRSLESGERAALYCVGGSACNACMNESPSLRAFLCQACYYLRFC